MRTPDGLTPDAPAFPDAPCPAWIVTPTAAEAARIASWQPWRDNRACIEQLSDHNPALLASLVFTHGPRLPALVLREVVRAVRHAWSELDDPGMAKAAFTAALEHHEAAVQEQAFKGLADMLMDGFLDVRFLLVDRIGRLDQRLAPYWEVLYRSLLRPEESPAYA
ncbi:hypothetical protein [Deinococcus soli (ex Cha et al. 2016)]|uniref:Uncharacterized protein n=2 Tax=Deinococcus soli (ex Cha et al. 2016) TaxID=1309411 RepID=A0AAE3XD13_9DEIO|nr:hypothetical protein [Deinococcus soli (ex Cha et al. 2016)]MDR6218663.1 hypothetical protein [Deinococcus soli (ex Cha et al. 2016)]MDR6328460.1 hypothetical protein [Deinococcus soli (ex Cha et al. 2016)]MDR6753071.1 hypothetical protein [Deinococcus soli (ex Cha et al. 2016)]